MRILRAAAILADSLRRRIGIYRRFRFYQIFF